MRPARDAIRLRARTPADTAFLREVYGGTRAEELARVPWSEEQKAAFVEQQFAAQAAQYDAAHPDASFLVIELAGERVGRLYVDRDDAAIHVIDIALLPAHRGRGIGGMLLAELLAEARASKRAVRIYVERFNPARRLYDRLGFVALEVHGVYDLMEWRADGVAAPSAPLHRRAPRGTPERLR